MMTNKEKAIDDLMHMMELPVYRIAWPRIGNALDVLAGLERRNREIEDKYQSAINLAHELGVQLEKAEAILKGIADDKSHDDDNDDGKINPDQEPLECKCRLLYFTHEARYYFTKYHPEPGPSPKE